MRILRTYQCISTRDSRGVEGEEQREGDDGK